ncbi:MAG: threonine--tRNA ligase [Piscirickettsiaceae bacterium]|nr:threonine--tRNA ligase [Piscirickettsiaceae bacterium]
MISVTFPDGSKRQFDQSISISDIASNIGTSLGRAALAGMVNGILVDISYIIEQDSNVAIITSEDSDGLSIIRHSTSHMMAQAVKRLFPKVKITIGPVVDNGFYYDFSYTEGFTKDDLINIEECMAQLVREDIPIVREEISREIAIRKFHDLGETYKVEILKGFPEDETISLYHQGDFMDLCRGPHVPSTGKLKVFKLTKLAGAYWKGNSNNEMLQRVYGTAWQNDKALKVYMARLEESERRDHRKYGKDLDLFHHQEEAAGMVFWHDKGWRIFCEVESYIRNVLRKNGYQEVRTPQVVDHSLWKKSGHWNNFGDMIFSTYSENRGYAIKPMNCPCHIQIFNQGLKSYRDLPLRMAEFGSCHRNELSGTLHGLMRLRSFTQDDAHIFCTEDQIQDEVSAFIDLLQDVYIDFGFNDIIIRLSTRPKNRVGSDEVWDKAEYALKEVLNDKNLNWDCLLGEGAFYGPKIEFSLKDCLGRVWQCGTIQVDFSMPERLDATYVAEDGSKQVPVMLHRAILGSLERFIGILIEEHAGALPTWLAPHQAVVIAISQNHIEYAQKVARRLQDIGFRVDIDLRNETIGRKIREHTLLHVPYLVVVGSREAQKDTVAVRTRKGVDLGAMKFDDFVSTLNKDVARRGQIILED